MAFQEFNGELDEPKSFKTFNGELDAPEKKGPSIPGAEEYDQRPNYEAPKTSIGDKIKGAGEAALTLGTGALAGPLAVGLGAVASGRDLLQGKPVDFQATADQIAQNLTYQPKTTSGSQIMEMLDPALQGLQALGPTGYGAIHAQKTGPLSKKIPEASRVREEPLQARPGEPMGDVFTQPEARTTLKPEEAGAGPLAPEKPTTYRQMDMFDQLDSVDNAQAALDARQKQLEFDVKKQATIDFNRAERQRQLEASVYSPEHRKLMADLEMERLANESDRAAAREQTGLFDTHPELADSGEVIAPQYGVNRGHGVFDENGMPIEAGQTLESRNLENPLQRNLFGDELGPALDQTRSLTDAIDIMPPGEKRQAALDLFKSEQRFDDYQGESTARVNQALASGDRATVLRTLEDNLARTKSLVDALPYANGKLKAQDYLDRQARVYDTIKAGMELEGANQRAMQTLASGPQRLDTMMAVLHDHLPAPLQVIARALTKVSGDTQVMLSKLDGGILGDMDSQANVIRLLADSPLTAALTLMHEGVHAATVRAVVTQDHLRSATETMMQGLLRADPTLKHEYGFTNVKEFLAEAMTNPKLQERLMNMDATGLSALEGRTIWQKFIDMIRQALGLENTKQVQNALDEAMRLGSTVMAEQYMGAGSPEHMRNYEATLKGNPSQTNIPVSAMDIGPQQRPDTIQNPTSPAKIQEKENARLIAKKLPSSGKLDQLSAVSTPEEAKVLAANTGWKDNAPDTFGRKAGSGANYHAYDTNNPLIKFANTMQRRIRSETNQFVRDHIAGPDGFVPAWNKLSGVEQADAVKALRAADRAETKITPALAREMGLNEKQMKYIDAFYKAGDASHAAWNKGRAELGLEPVKYREGYVPSVWAGSYRSLMTTADDIPVVIAVDSKIQLEEAKRYMQLKYPDATFVDEPRKALGGVGRQIDVFSGMNDVVQLLAKNDPRFAEVQAAVDASAKKSGDQLFGMQHHRKDKYGVRGSLGDAEYRSEAQNAQDFHKAMTQYFEQAAQHHAMQVPVHDLKMMIGDPNIPMPKTKRYLNEYVRNMEGKASDMGNALNTILDSGFELFGQGSGRALGVTSEVKNQMSRLFMGWGNYVFTLQQFLQIGQTGVPMMVAMAEQLGVNPAGVPKSAVLGMTNFAKALMADAKGVKADIPAHMQAAYKYAQDHGMLDFTEMEHDYQSQKGPVGRAIDKVADFNMMVGEKYTRTPVFMGFVDIMTKAGMPLAEALTKAENATYLSMFDYHNFERPMAYQQLGVPGKFAGALTTYKHGFVGNQVQLAKNWKKNPMALGATLASSLLLSGLTGLPFYDDIDDAFGFITNQMGKRENIRNALMKNFPEWAKTGIVSSALDINAYSKFSASNMLPDQVATTLSPQLSAAGKIVSDIWDTTQNRDRQAFGNLLYDLAPNGPLKGLVEDNFFRGNNGMLMDNKGDAKYMRDEGEWLLRKSTGLRSLREARAAEIEFKGGQRDRADEAALKDLGNKVTRQIKGRYLDQESFTDIAQKYKERGGDVESILPTDKKLEDIGTNQNVTPADRRKQALIDNPTPANIRKYKNYESQ